jgi:hypothetical protein
MHEPSPPAPWPLAVAGRVHGGAGRAEEMHHATGKGIGAGPSVAGRSLQSTEARCHGAEAIKEENTDGRGRHGWMIRAWTRTGRGESGRVLRD